LELLVRMEVVREVDFNEDKKRYEIIDKNNHHHHLVCNNCKTIEDVVLKENQLLEAITTKSKFKIDSHNLEFYGLCQNCQ
jgi:Fe2+ or Zn2+ uptake regulation protein